MTTPYGSRPKHLSSSPFKPAVEPEVEVFVVGDRITHDLYGLGTVTHADSHAVTIDCGGQPMRVRPPYAKLHHL